jgi:hypothetical protein
MTPLSAITIMESSMPFCLAIKVDQTRQFVPRIAFISSLTDHVHFGFRFLPQSERAAVSARGVLTSWRRRCANFALAGLYAGVVATDPGLSDVTDR